MTRRLCLDSILDESGLPPRPTAVDPDVLSKPSSLRDGAGSAVSGRLEIEWVLSVRPARKDSGTFAIRRAKPGERRGKLDQVESRFGFDPPFGVHLAGPLPIGSGEDFARSVHLRDHDVSFFS
jgi:hypothetical protein